MGYFSHQPDLESNEAGQIYGQEMRAYPKPDPVANDGFFHHEPLDRAGQWIRVLQLHPGSLESPIECTIRHIELGSEPYICLSYTWGDEDHREIILVNGLPFQVTENVWLFLSAMRRKNNHLPLWIDLLCIDQLNLEERNHQVQLMATIYRTASRVIAWLGEASTDQAELLLSLGGCDGDFVGFDAVSACQSDQQNRNNGPERVDLLEQRHWEAFRQLCWKSYWTRLWIVQEIVLAEAVTTMCGAVCISWPLLVGFCELVIRADDNQEPLGGRRKATRALVQNITSLARLPHGGHDASLHLGEVAVAFADQICRDFHDHVYGVLGLVEDGSDFQVDYGESALTLCTRVLEHDATRQVLSRTYIDSVLSSCNTLRRALSAEPPPSAIPTTVARTYTTQEPVGILLPARFKNFSTLSNGIPFDISFEVWLICKTTLPTASYPNNEPQPSKKGEDNTGLSTLEDPSGYAEHSSHSHSVPCVHKLQSGGRHYAIFSLFSRTETACTYRWTGGPGAQIRAKAGFSHFWSIRATRAASDDESRIPIPQRHNTNTASAGRDQPAPYVMLLPMSDQDPSLRSDIDNYATYMSTGIIPFRDGDPCFYPHCNKRLILLHDRDVPGRIDGVSDAAGAAAGTEAGVPANAEAPPLSCVESEAMLRPN